MPAGLKSAARRALFPPLWLVILSIPLAGAGLFVVFFCGLESAWFAPLLYSFSAYSLSLVCLRLWRARRKIRASCHALIEKHSFSRRYVHDEAFHFRVSLYASFSLNTLCALAKLLCGILYRSVWFMSLGVYYFLLALLRLLLLRALHQSAVRADRALALRRYRSCGIVLLVTDLALLGVVLLVVRQNEGFRYAGVLIYAVALYAFYNIIASCIHVFRYRAAREPLVSAAKIVRLTSALVSMLALETAMLAQFHTEEDPSHFRHLMTACTGGAVCLIIFLLALSMLLRARRELSQIAST